MKKEWDPSRALRALLLTALFMLGGGTAGAIPTINLPGVSEYEGWANMTSVNYPGYPGFPGGAPWPAPIDSNQPGSAGNVDFNKVSGNGYPASASVYAPFTSSVFEVETTNALGFDIETVVFQIDIGPGDGGVFFDALATLSFNGGSQSLSADYQQTVPGNYPFTNPINPTESGTTTVWQFQWDLAGLGPINTFEVQWTTHPHSQIYELQTDAGDTFAQVVPEPGTAILMMLGLAGLSISQRRR